MKQTRFGILSTASIINEALLQSRGKLEGFEIAAVASRDLDKAKTYAAQNNIPKAYGSYEELLADPDIDCIYICVPNALHKEWTIKSLDAGKHVLCEKPVASNAAEAQEIADKVKATGLTFAEAFHYRYHPLLLKVEEIVRSGDIGEVTEVSAIYYEVIRDRTKAQFTPKLSGGALMDTGCYCSSFCRWMAGCNDAKVISAYSVMSTGGVDGTTHATLRFANGVIGKVRCSIDFNFPVMGFVHGDKGSVFIHSPFTTVPLLNGKLVETYFCTVRRGFKLEQLRVPLVTTYHAQLEAFRDAVREGRQPITDAEEGVANMRIIDAIFKKSGGNKYW